MNLFYLRDNNPFVRVPAEFEDRKEAIRFYSPLFASDGEHLFTYGVVKDFNAKNLRVFLEVSIPGTRSWDRGIQFAYVGNDEAVYYRSELGGAKRIRCSAPYQLKWLGDRYVTDGENVFYDGAQVKGVDASSFERIGLGFGRDKRHCYYRHHKIRGAQRDTFRIFSDLDDFGSPSDVSTDGTKVFFGELEAQGVDATEFSVVKNEAGERIGFNDGKRFWNNLDLIDATKPEGRKLVHADSMGTQVFSLDKVKENAVELSLFLLFVKAGSIKKFLELRIKQVGEPRLLKAIDRLNVNFEEPLAVVSKEAITSTPLGEMVTQQLMHGMETARAEFDTEFASSDFSAQIAAKIGPLIFPGT